MPADSQRAASDVRYEFHRLGSVIGLLLGLACIVASVLGVSTNLPGAGPGVVVFVVGIFMVWIAKFKVTDIREVRARNTDLKEIIPSSPSNTLSTQPTAGPILPVAVASMPVAASAPPAPQSTLTEAASAQSPSVFRDRLEALARRVDRLEALAREEQERVDRLQHAIVRVKPSRRHGDFQATTLH